MSDSASLRSNEPDGANTGEASGLVLEDQAQSALHSLERLEGQAASLQDCKNFLDKRGLTEAEIDEAIRQAQPNIDLELESRVEVGASKMSDPEAPGQPRPDENCKCCCLAR